MLAQEAQPMQEDEADAVAALLAAASGHMEDNRGMEAAEAPAGACRSCSSLEGG